MSNTTPIDADEFVGLMKRAGVAQQHAGDPVRCAVAVSGGADSMALTLLVAEWGPAKYVTFDHGLREGSEQEAQQVHDWLTTRGLDHTILRRQGEKPTSNIQEAARLARYEAMESWCVDERLDTLLLAHHQEDQAETFLLRLARGSGVDGLGAMEPNTGPVLTADGPRLVRPLLDVPRARLRCTLETAGQGWIEDPSNEDVSFDRVKARGMLSDPPLEGLIAGRLAATAVRMGRVRSLLEALTEDLLREAVEISELGFCRIDREAILNSHEEIALRVLSRILMSFGGGRFPPRLESVEGLLAEMRDAAYAGGTLAGCRIIPCSDKQNLLIGREFAAIGMPVLLGLGEHLHWDHRFHIESSVELSCQVGALGEDGWRTVVEQQPSVKDLNLPQAFRSTLPAVRSGDALVYVGGVGFLEPLKIGIGCDFAPRRRLFRSQA